MFMYGEKTLSIRENLYSRLVSARLWWKLMVKKHTLTIVILTLAFLFSICPRVRIAQTSAVAVVYVDPPEIANLSIGDTFTVNITAANVSDLAGWSINLYYNPKVVNASSYEEGPFLKDVRDTLGIWVFDWNDNYNETHGHIELACFMHGTGSGADGAGTLVILTFKVKGLGYSPLILDETELRDSTSPIPQPIPHTTEDGLVDTRIHNIAITEVTPSKTRVTKNDSISINVTVQNAGNFTETFNLTIYCNTTAIATQTVTLTDGTSTIITFTWNTTGFAIGNYTIIATADPVPGETETEDNTLVNGVVNVALPPPITTTNITPLKTIVCQGYTITINVTTQNQGSTTQTFNLTTYYNTTEIETKTITQNGNSNLTTTFAWNTTNLTEYDNYTINAHADYNTLVDGTILIVHTGDVSPVDMKVRVDDILEIALAFGTTYPEPEYDAILDINCDLKIRVDDLLAAALEFGWTKP